ncbi:ankyrin repeat domain-containing protein [bacterium]|jgi:uncharacterized protein with HEPN domain|nr:ankyrin repeat domain-containing protein [bacterium]
MPLLDNRRILRERYEALYRQKDAALDDGTILSWDHDRKALSLIRDILVHTRDRWVEETDQQRRGSLDHIVRMSLLLRRQFKCIYNASYAAQGDQGEEINIWRDLDFLVQYQITDPDPRFHQPLPITFIDINDIFQELFRLIDTVLRDEIRVGLEEQPTFDKLGRDFAALPLDRRNRFQQHDERIRQPYRDPHQLPLLEAFATYGREKLRINRMLSAVQFARAIDVNTPHGKMALLRQLQIMGESCTGKNFSVAIKRLRQDIDWKLLVRLRNKLSHNEWDIHSGLLTTQVTIARLQAIQGDLVALDASIQLLQLDHDEISGRDRILRHYDPAWYLRPATRQLFLDFIRDCYIANLINSAQLIQRRNLIVGDIRNRDLLTEIRNDLAPVFSPFVPQTLGEYTHILALRRSYGVLARPFHNDTRYHRNQENPNDRARGVIGRRLAAHQVNIRQLHNALTYTQDSYKYDFIHHQDSFNPIRIINFIRVELTAIRSILTPLPSSEIVTEEIPEDSIHFSKPYIIDLLFKVMLVIYGDVAPRLRQAIRNIRNYCTLIRKPLYLEIPGLHGADRNEITHVDARLLFQKIRYLVNTIKTFGKECLFKSSLLNNPTIIEACFFHLARIQKYTVVLSKSNGVGAARLPSFEEFKALRNFIHHGCIVFETSTIEPVGIMIRYASLFLCQLPPAIDQIADTLLFSAATDGDLRAVNTLITQEGVNINSRHVDLRNGVGGKTSLFIAAEMGHHEIVNALINNGADINIRNDGNWSPYDVALVMEHQYGRVTCSPCVVLLKNRFLFEAAFAGDIDAVRYWLDQGTDINSKHTDRRIQLNGEIYTYRKKTSLFIAAEMGHHNILELLIERGANSRVRDAGLWRPYDVALVMEHQYGKNECSPCVFTLQGIS